MWELRSWQERLPSAVEFGKESPSIALRAHDERRSLQLINRCFAVCDLTKLNTMLSDRIFEFGQAN